MLPLATAYRKPVYALAAASVLALLAWPILREARRPPSSVAKAWPGLRQAALTAQRRTSLVVVAKTWAGYKRAFVTSEGRVRRLPEDDTVSEGQAYAMLRAAWLRDKAAFDLCYRWTEENLSRRKTAGDHLLAWHWRGGRVVDGMPAADADLDYALSLFFAEALWPGAAPRGLIPYGKRAALCAGDILRRLTYKADRGRLFLSPWILPRGAKAPFPVNPSYYSPAHFRIFHQRTGDKRWLELVDTTYRLLERLARDPDDGNGSGLVPDWCAVDLEGRLTPLEGKSAHFGWDAIRVPLRVGWDLAWFDAPQADAFFRSGLADFVERTWASQGSLRSEYHRDGSAPKGREDPAFYAAYFYASAAVRSKTAPALLRKSRSFLNKGGDGWDYGKDRYYTNSLAWLADGLASGLVKNLCAEPLP